MLRLGTVIGDLWEGGQDALPPECVLVRVTVFLEGGRPALQSFA